MSDADDVGQPLESPRRGKTVLLKERAQRQAARAKERYEGSSAETLWGRLNALDFVNEGMLFAALLLLCLFPSMIVIGAVAGHNASSGIARHIGLNHQAAADVQSLFNSTAATSSAVTATSWIFVVLSLVGVAAALQGLYEKIFGLDRRGMRDFLRQLIWIGALIGVVSFTGWAGPAVRRFWSGPVFLGVLAFVLNVAFWWWTTHFLLSRRVGWRRLLPCAVATSICWLGLGAFSALFFSNTIISDRREYGSIGVVFGLMSWLIAVGVVIILGAVIGIVWEEHGHSLRAVSRRLRPRS